MTNNIEQVCKLHSGLYAQIASLEQRINDLCKLLDLQILNMEKAVNVAKETLNLRLESMNEFRGQMSDQAINFITRAELNAHIDKLESRLSAMEKSVNEKFELVLRPVIDKLSTIEATYNQKLGARVWEIAIVSSCLSVIIFTLVRYIFKF